MGSPPFHDHDRGKKSTCLIQGAFVTSHGTRSSGSIDPTVGFNFVFGQIELRVRDFNEDVKECTTRSLVDVTYVCRTYDFMFL